MERMTDKRMKGDGFVPVGPKEYKAFVKNKKPSGKQIYQRLLDIEDILGDTYDIDRLRELVEADRDGRCEIHVAKDGGTVYSIFAYVNGLHIRKSNGEPITKIVPCVVDDFTRATVDREFGKTVFRTREDAEQALREWENKKENQQMGMGHRI